MNGCTEKKLVDTNLEGEMGEKRNVGVRGWIKDGNIFTEVGKAMETEKEK